MNSYKLINGNSTLNFRLYTVYDTSHRGFKIHREFKPITSYIRDPCLLYNLSSAVMPVSPFDWVPGRAEMKGCVFGRLMFSIGGAVALPWHPITLCDRDKKQVLPTGNEAIESMVNFYC